MSHMMENHWVEQLSQVAGLRPSPKWIEACQNHLHQHGVAITADNILFQALDIDLRNVIRLDSNSSSISSNDSSSILLRRKCKESMSSMGNVGAKSTLPSDFRLCMQIEELLDVSKNAEERLALGPASSASPTPIGDQSRRCMKMLMSDGYFDNGSSNPSVLVSDDPLSIHSFTAMETSPIPNLSVQSHPGIKVVISGPVDIRYGILMLHPGNTFVLGGCIPSLIPIQRKAMELAAKEAGVGIDPTFRALVWNPEAGIDETDEGEQESSDMPPVSSPIHPQNQNEQAINTAAVDSNPISSISTENRVPSEPSRRSIQTHQDQQRATSNSMAHHPKSNDTDTSESFTTIDNPYSNRPRQNKQESINPYHANATLQLNPYSVKSQSNERSDTGSFKQNSFNPYHNKTKGSTSIAEHVDTNVSTSNDSSVIPEEQRNVNHTGAANSTSVHVIPTNTSPPPDSPTARNISMTNVYGNLSPSALTEPMTFLDFHSLLQKIISDSILYKKYEDVVFVVPCKLYVGKDSNKNVS